jgi:hypothetical protein
VKFFVSGDEINVFVHPRTVRRYRIRADGTFAEINPEQKPLKTINSEQLKKDIDRMGWGYEL